MDLSLSEAVYEDHIHLSLVDAGVQLRIHCTSSVEPLGWPSKLAHENAGIADVHLGRLLIPRRRQRMAKLLLVEDNEMNRDMLSRRLQRKGYEVVMAVDGQQGLDLARSQPFDLILMDMSLPVVDGWDATRQLKAEERTRSIPVIALTAHAMAGDREKALEAGCDDYDTKPIELPRLLEKIDTLLKKQASA
jgi:CheY-like chemotaxis protein